MIFTIYDLETNGRIEKDQNGFNQFPEILEVGYIQMNEKLEILRGGTLNFYRPEWKLRPDALAVNGLSKEYLQLYEKDFGNNMICMYPLFYNACIIGKNNHRFDDPILKWFITKYSYKCRPEEIRTSWDMEKICTPHFRKYYQEKYGQATRKFGTLEELVEMCGYTKEQAMEMFKEQFPNNVGRSGFHSALFDAYMTYLVTKYMVEEKRFDLMRGQ